TYLLGRDLVQQYDLDTYLKAKAAGALPLMWFELVVLAPLGEEILFRGFLQQGWVRSPQSLWPATAVIAALWASLHTQYGLYDIFQIFLMGLLFGWVRWWSGSTLLTMLMHGLANIWYLLEAMTKIE